MAVGDPPVVTEEAEEDAVPKGLTLFGDVVAPASGKLPKVEAVPARLKGRRRYVGLVRAAALGAAVASGLLTPP